MIAHRTVLYLVDESPYVREHDAMTRRISRAVDLLESHGWETTTVTIRGEWGWHDIVRSAGRNAASLRSPHYWQIPIAALRLALLLRRRRVDVIHASGALAALISGLSRFVAPQPVRIYERHHFVGRPRLRLSSRLAARWSDHTIACSMATGRLAVETDGSSPTEVSVVHAAGDPPRDVTLDEVLALRARLGIAAGEPVIVIVARLRPEKGHLVLLEAMRLAAHCYDTRIHAVLVGAGPFEKTIKESIRQIEPFQLHMVGHQPDVAPWMAIADVVAMPSLIEPFGKVAYEALAAGRPLVASRVGGIPEIVVDNETGVLVPPDDPNALADALIRVLSDDQLRMRLETGGPAAYKERFTLEKRIKSWVECYEAVLRRVRVRSARAPADPSDR